MPFLLMAATFFRGWAAAAGGRAEEGIAQMRASLSDPMVAERMSAALLLVALAETCGKNGRVKEGLDLVARGLATAETTDQKLIAAELHRLRGELLTLEDPNNLAEAVRS